MVAVYKYGLRQWVRQFENYKSLVQTAGKSGGKPNNKGLQNIGPKMKVCVYYARKKNSKVIDLLWVYDIINL